MCMCVCLYISLNIFVLYEVRVMSQESKRLIITRTESDLLNGIKSSL
jgi:hypothetical protein